MPEPRVPLEIPLRVLRSEVVSGEDAASLTIALNSFFKGAGSAKLVAMFHTAAFEVVVVYT